MSRRVLKLSMKHDPTKANGVHYTPPDLAEFLADAMVRHLPRNGARLRLLDPACGDGILLRAIVGALPTSSRKLAALTGFETDSRAVQNAQNRLSGCAGADVDLRTQDFLFLDGVESLGTGGQQTLFDNGGDHREKYDAVIANPPYVRTQILGSHQAQLLAKRFNLNGRVDLYQAFTLAMTNALKPGGVLGLLTSNRFLTIRAGESLRRALRTEFDLREIYDLGDTKLFSAAVLPVIVVATKRRGPPADEPCVFDRVYERKANGSIESVEYPTILQALRTRQVIGAVKTAAASHYWIERGVLAQSPTPDDVWTLSTPEYDGWLGTVRSHQQATFNDVAKVRVGIKTTADEVFVRTDWQHVPREQRPEDPLLRRLITHFDVARWVIASSSRNARVLYPHVIRNGRRVPITLDDYPRARAYLHAHKPRLERRTYVLQSGRQWYEIWVPHNPEDWDKPKLVFPDISEKPRFCMDESGAVVQGDCYWITLKPGADPDWLLLMLAVANSTFITKFYDIAFHNKLYSGRRRFMTQYVKDFPLPPLSSAASKKIIQATRRLVERKSASAEAEATLDRLVWRAFGLVEEVAR